MATHVTSRKAPAVTASIMSDQKLMIVRLPAQGASFSHFRRLASGHVKQASCHVICSSLNLASSTL